MYHTLVPWWVYTSWYMYHPTYPGYTYHPPAPGVMTEHVRAVHGETAWALFGNNPWVGELYAPPGPHSCQG